MVLGSATAHGLWPAAGCPDHGAAVETIHKLETGPMSPTTPQDPSHLVLVQELAARGDLHALLARSGQRCLAERQAAVLVIRPLLAALAALHGRGVVHR